MHTHRDNTGLRFGETGEDLVMYNLRIYRPDEWSEIELVRMKINLLKLVIHRHSFQ